VVEGSLTGNSLRGIDLVIRTATKDVMLAEKQILFIFFLTTKMADQLCFPCKHHTS